MKTKNIFSIISLSILTIGIGLSFVFKPAILVVILGLLLAIVSFIISKNIPLHYKLPLIVLSFLQIGATIKIMHWSGANIILVYGSLSLILSLIFYLIKRLSKINYKAQPYLDILISVLYMYFSVYALFKIMHWGNIPYPNFLSPIFILSIWTLQLIIEAITIKKENFAKIITVIMIVLFGGSSVYLITYSRVTGRIIEAFIRQDEQGLEQNSRIIESINGVKKKLLMLKIDVSSRESAIPVEPILHQVTTYANKTDDYFLSELNEVLYYSEGVKNWFTKEHNTQITYYRDFYELTRPEDYDISSNLFGGETDSRSFHRGDAMRLKLIEYRNYILLELYNSQKNIKDSLTKETLSSLEVFQSFLTNQKSEIDYQLTNIYEMLTKPEYVAPRGEAKSWSEARFYHQPVIGVISTFTSLRNDIRLVQQIASKILLNRIDIPMYDDLDIKIIQTTEFLNLGDSSDTKIMRLPAELIKDFETIDKKGLEENKKIIESIKTIEEKLKHVQLNENEEQLENKIINLISDSNKTY